MTSLKSVQIQVTYPSSNFTDVMTKSFHAGCNVKVTITSPWRVRLLKKVLVHWVDKPFDLKIGPPHSEPLTRKEGVEYVAVQAAMLSLHGQHMNSLTKGYMMKYKLLPNSVEIAYGKRDEDFTED